jgi:hypothetical protein
MPQQTEEILRAGMADFTADVTVPPGLVTRAVRHRRRQRMTAAAAGASAVAVAAAAVVAAVVTSAAPATTMRARTAAYVINHTEAALATLAGENVIQYLHETATGRNSVEVSNLRAGTYSEWAYQGQAHWVVYASDGQPSTAMWAVVAGSHYTTTMADYRSKTWWQQTVPASPGLTGPAPARFGLPEGVTGPALSTNWAAGIRQALKGEYTVTGSALIDGVQALKLTPAAPVQRTPDAVFWVNPSNYLPVRELVTLGLGNTANALQIDFQWLRPSHANLATVAVTIPPGFTQVPPPKGFVPGT